MNWLMKQDVFFEGYKGIKKSGSIEPLFYVLEKCVG